MECDRRRRGRHFIQIAPLVDVVFLLLLFFLLSYHLEQEERIRLVLPHSQSAEASQAASPPTVDVTREGDIHYMGTKTTLLALRGLVRSSRRGDAADAVRIRADREVAVGLLVQVIDEIRGGGIRHLSIATERK